MIFSMNPKSKALILALVLAVMLIEVETEANSSSLNTEIIARYLSSGKNNNYENSPAQPQPLHLDYPSCNKRLLGLFQGDIMIRDPTRFMDRSAMTNKEGRWPEGIVPYEFDDTFSDSDRKAIRLAMDEFEKQTCIKWIEKTDEEAYIAIENDLGCWAEPGMMGGVQSLSLERPICLKKGVMMHEMMHALGFWHEHTRPDRNDYVQVEWDNIEEGMEPNFEKMTSRVLDTLGLDYDYRSLVHYTAYNFAVDRSKPTLRPKNEGVALKDLGYGQLHAELTELDVAKINKFYECPSK